MPQRPETESSIEHFREQANKSPRKVPETSIPPSPVPPVVPIPAQPARYDPYNEDFEDKPGFEITPLQGHDDGPLESDHESAGEDKEMTMNTEEEEQVRLVAQRNSDEFVNLAYAQALPIITQLLNEDAVMRRLKELKAEQDKMERQLWDKRLDIVKIHRARMNKAKEGADRVITIDSDDDEVKEKEVSDLVGEGLTEEEREKTLARRRKIMSVIESVMSDTMDQ
ncbi:hypothetical protein QFC19_008061 [Naganishia cerealis]|uniref:Uncharacterized protein n=1 Tax=Naganishia cerealis TaxID=610337 RepID=A0ACC2V540_9TREE|nr:hypothetical protein QFC19_008061 [Naganishia cerealis]